MKGTCEKLRLRIVAAKAERNDALRENATDENNAQSSRHTQADVDALRLAVDLAALEARNAGCAVDDLAVPAWATLTPSESNPNADHGWSRGVHQHVTIGAADRRSLSYAGADSRFSVSAVIANVRMPFPFGRIPLAFLDGGEVERSSVRA